jgi:hypothetical protein
MGAGVLYLRVWDRQSPTQLPRVFASEQHAISMHSISQETLIGTIKAMEQRGLLPPAKVATEVGTIDTSSFCFRPSQATFPEAPEEFNFGMGAGIRPTAEC